MQPLYGVRRSTLEARFVARRGGLGRVPSLLRLLRDGRGDEEGCCEAKAIPHGAQGQQGPEELELGARGVEVEAKSQVIVVILS